MRKYALVNNFVVTRIVDIDENDYGQYANSNSLVIDITDLDPQPQINWVLDGNKLEFPVNKSSREDLEIELAAKKTEFGIALAKIAVNRIGARNKILNKTGTQVATLLNQLLGIKLLLETGALGTARYSSLQLKSVYTEYGDVFDFIINEINVFENTNGL